MSDHKKENKKDKSNIEEIKKQAEEYLAGWQRARADYENLKKQSEKDREDFIKFANSNLLFGLIPVYDNLKLALEHLPADMKDDNFAVGIEHIKKQFKQVLEHNGLEEIIPQPGDEFNPEIHEAIQEKNSDKNEFTGKISRVTSHGYKLNGKIFMPAKVIVN